MEDFQYSQWDSLDSGKPRDFSELERQLQAVVERDGVTMQTSTGTRTRARRPKVTSQPFVVSTKVESRAPAREAVSDAIGVIDQVHISTLTAQTRGPKRSRIRITQGVHDRSPFVVSLQQVLLNTSATNAPRVDIQEVLRETRVTAEGVSVHAFAASGADLMVSGLEEQNTSNQFTAATFEEAYVQVYGTSSRVTETWHRVRFGLQTLFHRAEHVERAVIEDVEESLGVVAVPRFSYARALLGFIGFAVVATLPANAISWYHAATRQGVSVVADGNQAVSQLRRVAGVQTVDGAIAQFADASERFRDIGASLGQVNALALAAAAASPSAYRGTQALAEVGDKSSEAGKLLSTGIQKALAAGNLVERAEVLGVYVTRAQTLLQEADSAVHEVDPAKFPADIQGKIIQARTELSRGAAALNELQQLTTLIAALAGKESMRSYLVLFQNQTELRPTGGFIGSFAEVRVNNGEIQSISVPGGGSYDLKGQLTARVASPKPLSLISPVWQFQDSNWSPDFPTSAEKIRWFWSKSGQPTIDGVIAINAQFVQRLLGIIGPVEVPEFQKTITAENFLLETQKSVELEYDRVENAPKKIIGLLLPRIRERLAAGTPDQWLKVAQLISESVQIKDIQVSLRREEEDDIASESGWRGELSAPDADGLALIETNIAGQKTDGVVAESVKQNVRIAADGQISTTLTLHREHQGQKGELFRGVRNVVYLRAYVPKGAELLSASGFESPDASLFKIADPPADADPGLAAMETAVSTSIPGVKTWQESGWQVFGGWMQLDPGNTQDIVISYRLPRGVQEMGARFNGPTYLLQLVSQSGKSNRQVTTTVTVDPRWRVKWSSAGAARTSSGIVSEGIWDRNRVVAVLLESSQGYEADSAQALR